MKARFQIMSTVLLFVFFNASAQLNGTYTIDATQTATTTNYLNFSSAVSDLESGTRTDGGPANGAGVSGPVVFNIAAGTYNEQIVINQIAGASSINTITFDGGTGNAATRILTFYTTINPANYAVLTLYGSEWIRIKNITVENTSTSADGWGILIWGTQLSATPVADNNIISNCIVNMPVVTSDVNNNLYGIALTGSQTTINTPGKFTNCTIDSCTINNGYSGITAYGWSNNTGNVFSHNDIVNAYARGIEVIGTTSAFPIKILNNHVESNSDYASNRGIYLINCAPSTTDFIEISGNTIPSFNQVGIALSVSHGNDSIHNRIYNNFIGGNLNLTNATGARGLSVSSDYTDVWFNSVDINVPTTVNTMSAFTCSSGAHYDVRNNIFSYSAASGVGLPFYYVAGAPDTTNLTQFDHNVFYNGGSTDIAYIDGAMYSNTTLIGANGFNMSSVITNPNFDYNAATNFLHLSGDLNYGTPIPGITNDIDENLRDASTPDAGADEFAGCALALMVDVNDATCFGCSDGGIALTVVGTTQPVTILWSNGATTASITGLPAGDYSVCVNDAGGCSICDTITVSEPTGIMDATPNALVDVFPNPSNGAFTVNILNKRNGLVELTNVTGQVIHTEHFNGNYNRTFNLQTASGVVLIRVSSGKETLNAKIIFTR